MFLHVIINNCVYFKMEQIKYVKFLTNDNFRAPFENGWTRELVYSTEDKKKAEVYYICPAGNRMRTKRDVSQNMDKSLDIDTFSFAKRPLGFTGEIVRTASAEGFRAIESIAKLQQSNVNKKYDVDCWCAC